jgi:hypothetical protein
MAQSKSQGLVGVGCSNVLGGIIETTVSTIASTKILLQIEPCADSPTSEETGEAVPGLAAGWPRGGEKLLTMQSIIAIIVRLATPTTRIQITIKFRNRT